MSFIKDVLSFEKFNLRDMWGKLKDDPERALLGGIGPFGTALWGKVLGKDYDPIVNALGGPPASTYDKAAAAGIDVGAGRTMHDIASIIAGAMAGGYGAGKLPLGNVPMGNSAIGKFPIGNFGGQQKNQANLVEWLQRFEQLRKEMDMKMKRDAEFANFWAAQMKQRGKP